VTALAIATQPPHHKKALEMADPTTQDILLQTMKEYAAEMRGMRSDFKDLATSLASVKTLTAEIASTRHQLRDELGGMITQAHTDAAKIAARISEVELELAQKRGREEVLQWLAGGSSVAGLISVISILWGLVR
jgi:septal ring factor EnvC (AmiA/AmiB activator)